MSVVNSCLPCYRGDATKHIAAHLPYRVMSKYLGLFDYTLSPTGTMFEGLPAGNRKQMILEGHKADCDWEFSMFANKQVMRILEEASDWEIDTKACYSFVSYLDELTSLLPRSQLYVAPDCIPAAMKLVKDCGLVNPNDFLAAANRVASTEDAGVAGDKSLNLISRMKTIVKMRSVRDHVRAQESGYVRTKEHRNRDVLSGTVKDLKSILINYLPLSGEFPNAALRITFLCGVFFVYLPDGRGLALTAKDLDRIAFHVNAVSAMTKFGQYMDETYNDGTVNTSLVYFRSLVKAGKDMDKVPEAFVSASNISINILAGFLSRNGMAEMIADHIEEGLELVIPHQDFLNRLSGLNDKQHRAFRSIIRVALPPSYDVPGIFCKEKELHSTKNPVGGEIGNTDEDKAASEKIYTDFLAYNRLSFIRQFYLQYHRYPGKVDDPVTDDEKKYNRCVAEQTKMTLTLDLASAVNLRGCLAYQKRSSNIAAHFKDTAMAPHSYTPSKCPQSDTNQLVHLATAEETLDLEKYRSSLATDCETHFHKVGFKNESAKEMGRLFFIAELPDKMLLGEVEDNVGAFLKGVPGNAVGAPPHDVANTIFKSMCVAPAADEAKLLVSDDISKWSPYMPLRVQKDSTAFWEEVFDQPWMTHIDKLNENDTVVLDAQGWRAHYPSNGSNKEGQTGKRMSYLMTNLKAFAIARCRGKYGGEKLFSGAAHLLTFLDDGFTAVDLKVEGYKATAAKVLNELVHVQEKCGFKMKLKKSFPSDRFCQFLAREYFMGGRVYDYTKSIVKRCLFSEDIVTALTEDIREVGAWGSGAVESGTPKEYVYSCYLADCCKAVARKTRIQLEADPKQLVWLFAPTASGGCGAMPPHGILASLVKDMYVEQLEIVRAAALLYPSVRTNYAKILNAECTHKSGRGILRAHKTVTLGIGKMSEQRVTRALEDRFITNGTSAYLRDLVAMCSGDELEEFGNEVAAFNPQALGVNLDDLYESSPLAMYDSILAKFKKSSTLTDALGQVATRQLIKAYQNDAKKCFDVWVNT